MAEAKVQEGRGSSCQGRGIFLKSSTALGKSPKTLNHFNVSNRPNQTERHSTWKLIMEEDKQVMMNGEPGKLEAQDLFSEQ